MRRKKLQIVSLILETQHGSLERIQNQAFEWSDIIRVVSQGDSLTEAWNDINSTMGADTVRVVGLCSSWVVSNPHIVRDVIEMNYKRVVRAQCYFMDGARYFSDGLYRQRSVVFSYQLMQSNKPFSGVSPAHTWRRDFVNAPFDVLDFATQGLGLKGTLRDYEEVIP